jgi:hypothetical protein
VLSLPWGGSSTTGNSTSYGVQLAFDDATIPTALIRGKNNSWGSWYELYNSGKPIKSYSGTDLILSSGGNNNTIEFKINDTNAI